jgi:hypothetical protein
MKVVRLDLVDIQSVVRDRSEDKLNADGIDNISPHEQAAILVRPFRRNGL